MANDLIDPQTGEILEGEAAVETISMAAGLAKAEINQQIATARQYPRSVSRCVKSMTSLATLSQDAAAECNYALPRGGKTLTGPSIRLAELVVSQWGNCRVGARVVHVDRVEKFLEAEGVFHDLETNSATTARVRRKISDRNGRLFNDDMITVAGNAACSIAKRNAVLAGVPKAAWMPAYEAALSTVKGDQKTLAERREGAMRALGAFGITPDMLYEYLDVGGFEDITLDHMPALIAMHKGLKEGETTVEQLFNPKGEAAPKAGASGKAKPEGMADKLKDAVGGGEDAGKAAAEEQGQQKAETASEPSQDGGKDTPEGEAAGEAEGEGQQAADEPSAEDLDDAEVRGAAAASKGRSRNSPPKGIKESPKLLKAWQDGFDEQKKIDSAGEGDG